MKTRFRLRSFLIGVGLIALLFGAGMIWLHSEEAEYLRQQQVAERIKACGADITWEQQVPVWLTWMGNSSAFNRVAAVMGGRLDCVLKELPNLPEARQIITSSNQLNRDTLDRLAKLDQVTTVSIGYGPAVLPTSAGDSDISPDEIDARLSQKTIIKLP